MAAEFTTEACKRGKSWHLSPGHEVLLNSGSPEKGFALEPHKENTSLRGMGTFTLGVQSSITTKYNVLTPTSMHHPGGDLSVESLTMRCVLSTSHRAPAPCADGSQRGFRQMGIWVLHCEGHIFTCRHSDPNKAMFKDSKCSEKKKKSLHKSIGQHLSSIL